MQPTSFNEKQLLNQNNGISDTPDMKQIKQTGSSSTKSIKKSLAGRMKRLKTQLGFYLNLVKLYTPVGKLTDKIKSPKSLSKWNPFKNLSPGLLTGKLRLPSPAKLSDKPVNTSRITKWATKNILQASKLADTQNDEALKGQIITLKQAIKNKDEENVLTQASKLASYMCNMLKNSSVVDSNMPMKYMQELRNITQYASDINRLDRWIRTLTAKPEKVNITNVPKDKKELLQIAIDHCIPLTQKLALEQLSQQDVANMKMSWLVNRSKLECKLFQACHKLESPVGAATWEKHSAIEKEVEDINAKFPKLPIFSPIGGKEAAALKVLNDIINGRSIATRHSSLTPLLCEFFKHSEVTKGSLLGATDDLLKTVEAMTPVWVHQSGLESQIAQWCEDTIQQTISQLGNRILDSLAKNNPLMHSDDIKRMISDLSRNAKITPETISTQSMEMTSGTHRAIMDQFQSLSSSIAKARRVK